jgi:hypothetical protein
MENKLTKGVFIDIITDDTNMITNFLNEERTLKQTKSSKEFLSLYKDKLTDVADTLTELSDIEEIILQYRSLNNLDDIKFSIIRDYIYARTPFYRKGKKTKDIRVIVSKVSDVVDSEEELDTVYNDQRFIQLAKVKLTEAIKSEIQKTKSLYYKK